MSSESSSRDKNDIFTSLRESLMSDLLSDIEGSTRNDQQSNIRRHDLIDNITNLEKILDFNKSENDIKCTNANRFIFPYCNKMDKISFTRILNNEENSHSVTHANKYDNNDLSSPTTFKKRTPTTKKQHEQNLSKCNNINPVVNGEHFKCTAMDSLFDDDDAYGVEKVGTDFYSNFKQVSGYFFPPPGLTKPKQNESIMVPNILLLSCNYPHSNKTSCPKQYFGPNVKTVPTDESYTPHFIPRSPLSPNKIPQPTCHTAENNPRTQTFPRYNQKCMTSHDSMADKHLLKLSNSVFSKSKSNDMVQSLTVSPNSPTRSKLLQPSNREISTMDLSSVLPTSPLNSEKSLKIQNNKLHDTFLQFRNNGYSSSQTSSNLQSTFIPPTSIHPLNLKGIHHNVVQSQSLHVINNEPNQFQTSNLKSISSRLSSPMHRKKCHDFQNDLIHPQLSVLTNEEHFSRNQNPTSMDKCNNTTHLQSRDSLSQDNLCKKRIYFNNPSPRASSMSAKFIPTTTMTPRELCQVVYSIMRPLLSFPSVLDAFNADYYRWNYEDRVSGNLICMGNVTSLCIGLPNPVWKETKMKALELENKFYESVDKRATNWCKEKQILGKVARMNVNRPRALLATSVLSTNSEIKVLSNDHDHYRTMLWKARLAVDKAFTAYLELKELKRLFQSRCKEKPESVNKNELFFDVEENINKLHIAFGITKNQKDYECNVKELPTTYSDVNTNILSRTLSLRKGRILLSRIIDEGVLPHTSACNLLSATVQVVLETSVSNKVGNSIHPPAGEERLLGSFMTLVRTTDPSVHPKNIIDCIDNVVRTCLKCATNTGKEKSVRDILSRKRSLMELLYSVISCGNNICKMEENYRSDWKINQNKFIDILTEN